MNDDNIIPFDPTKPPEKPPESPKSPHRSETLLGENIREIADGLEHLWRLREHFNGEQPDSFSMLLEDFGKELRELAELVDGIPALRGDAEAG